MKRHRHQEFIRFLNVIDAKVAKKKTVHVIVDNYAAHKHPKVLEWIENHPRFVFHFTPTSASWLNAVESFTAQDDCSTAAATSTTAEKSDSPRMVRTSARWTQSGGILLPFMTCEHRMIPKSFECTARPLSCWLTSSRRVD
jgi:hypothetical protein